MYDKRDLWEGSGYRITLRGVEALHDQGVCACKLELTGVMLECHKCGTVYGAIRDHSASRMDYRDWKRS